MNTKPEGSWSRESLRATMDAWWKLFEFVPVTRPKTSTLDFLTTSRFGCDSWPFERFIILYLIWMLHGVDLIRCNVSANRAGIPLKKMYDSVTMYDIATNSSFWKRILVVLVLRSSRKWHRSMLAQIVLFKHISRVQLLNGVQSGCWQPCNLDALLQLRSFDCLSVRKVYIFSVRVIVPEVCNPISGSTSFWTCWSLQSLAKHSMALKHFGILVKSSNRRLIFPVWSVDHSGHDLSAAQLPGAGRTEWTFSTKALGRNRIDPAI